MTTIPITAERDKAPLCTCGDRPDPDWNGRHESECPWLLWSTTTISITAERLAEIERYPRDTKSIEAIPELIAEVRRLRDELDHATCAEGDHLSKASRRMVETVIGDRDALREQVRQLRLLEACQVIESLAGQHTLHNAVEDDDDYQIAQRLRALLSEPG